MVCHVEIPFHARCHTPESNRKQRFTPRPSRNFYAKSDHKYGFGPSASLRNHRHGVKLAVSTFTHQEDSSLSTTEPTALAARTAPSAPATLSSDALLDLVLTSLDDDKAEDIVTIDLRSKSAMADHMVVASGRSTRQVAAMAQKLMDRLKETFRLTARVEGKDTGDWVLIDTGDVVVHIFRPEVREFYQLEKMWQDAGRVPAS